MRFESQTHTQNAHIDIYIVLDIASQAPVVALARDWPREDEINQQGPETSLKINAIVSDFTSCVR